MLNLYVKNIKSFRYLIVDTNIASNLVQIYEIIISAMYIYIHMCVCLCVQTCEHPINIVQQSPIILYVWSCGWFPQFAGSLHVLALQQPRDLKSWACGFFYAAYKSPY